MSKASKLEIQIKSYKEAKKAYEEFKKLRASIGKPVQPTIDPEQIRKDLVGADFFTLLEEIKRRKS